MTITRCAYLLCGVLLLGLMAAGLAAPEKKDEIKPPAGVPNFAVVAENIYRGAAPTNEGLKNLKALGVRTIIDLRIEKKALDEQKIAEKMGFTWINLRMGREAPTQKQVDTFLHTLSFAADEPVFVHCQHGADRTGAMIGIYRVQIEGWSFADTWKEMRKFGFKPYLDELKAAVQDRATK